MSEEQVKYNGRQRSIIFVSIPIPMDILESLESLATSADNPIENVASLLLADAVRASVARVKSRSKT